MSCETCAELMQAIPPVGHPITKFTNSACELFSSLCDAHHGGSRRVAPVCLCGRISRFTAFGDVDARHDDSYCLALTIRDVEKRVHTWRQKVMTRAVRVFNGRQRAQKSCDDPYFTILEFEVTRDLLEVDSVGSLMGGLAQAFQLSAAGGGSSSSPSPATLTMKSKQALRKRCYKCNKKVQLMIATGFKCKCSFVFCALCRAPEEHGCTFDYQAAGKAALRKTIGPKIEAAKLERI